MSTLPQNPEKSKLIFAGPVLRRFETAEQKMAFVMGAIRRIASTPEADGPAERPEAAAGPPQAALDLNQYTIRLHEGRCRCRACEVCGLATGIKLRHHLVERVDLFKRPFLMTFTVDRAKFKDPEEAYRFVRRNKLLPRLLRYLDVKNWFVVMEFQQKTGDGWPHWHILADVSHLPRHKPIDFARLWGLWRDKWGVGGLDVTSEDARNAKTSLHAINYITKYLLKRPERGYPQWYLSSSRIRLYSASRSLGRLSGRLNDSKSRPSDDEHQIRDASTPVIDRVSRCGSWSDVIADTVDQATGEVRHFYLGRVEGRRLDLAKGYYFYAVNGFPDLHGIRRFAGAADGEESSGSPAGQGDDPSGGEAVATTEPRPCGCGGKPPSFQVIHKDVEFARRRQVRGGGFEDVVVPVARVDVSLGTVGLDNSRLWVVHNMLAELDSLTIQNHYTQAVSSAIDTRRAAIWNSWKSKPGLQWPSLRERTGAKAGDGVGWVDVGDLLFDVVGAVQPEGGKTTDGKPSCRVREEKEDFRQVEIQFNGRKYSFPGASAGV